MESKDYFKNCACCYFDDIIKIESSEFDNILTNKKSYENFLVYVIGAKAIRIRFDKVNGFVRFYDGT